MEETIQNYRHKRLRKTEDRLEVIRQPVNYLDSLLAGRSEEAKQEFIRIEREILPEVSMCGSIDELQELCFHAFGLIPGIGERTIMDYVFHAAYIRDMDPEANCACFLITPAKKVLQTMGMIQGKTIRLGRVQDLFRGFNPMVFVDFANKHYKGFIPRI